ncbi:hypothetical protein [Desertivirga xinjiangensis]|uniref:hypothetical protein n=1 Tax=Desertivirga xinjiangensis TaxID=539206 RepID=UPI00210A8D92|nr:hypothetical protein [Pedobacter xinjiangensis]
MNFKKPKFYAAVLLSAFTAFSACKKDDGDDNNQETEFTVLQGEIRGTRKLSADTTYLLRSFVRVMAGGRLEIPAGTIIKGEKATNAALIVERDGDIIANGTASNPIVFTSDQEVKAAGDWAGIVICGKSTVNTESGTAQYESGVLGSEVANYGGEVPTDNSGEFSYVRIEFAGYPIQVNKEINGLTLCGVGSGTKVHHVQVSYGGDDSFEFFGGTVNASHLIAYRGVDDDFDFDQGYSGKIQYAISIKDPNVADISQGGMSRGVEASNGSAVSEEQYSRPVLSNFTFIGPGGGSSSANHGAGIHIGTSSRLVLANSIIVNHKTNALELSSDFAANSLKNGQTVVSNNVFFGAGNNFGLSSVATTIFADAAALGTFLATGGNTTVANLNAVGFTSTNIDAPNLTLTANSVANGKAAFTGDLATGFETTATYAGAMGTSNWTAGWANWTPKSTTY